MVHQIIIVFIKNLKKNVMIIKFTLVRMLDNLK